MFPFKMAMLELTLAILKPNVAVNPVAVNYVRNLLLTYNFKIVRHKRKKCESKELEKFYEEHKNKFFYNRLITFMRSGPSEFYVLTKENAVKDWRTLLGPTKVYKTQFEQPESLRGLFGHSDTRNAFHGSDSTLSAKREIEIFFPDFSVNKWLSSEENKYLCDNAALLEDKPVTIFNSKYK